MKPYGAALLAALFAAAPAPAQTLDEALQVFYRNDMDASLPLFERLAAENPADPDVRVWLGDVHLRRGDPLLAAALAFEALQMRPCHAAAHALLASTYTRHWFVEPGGLDSLWTHVRRATECDPADGNAWLGYWMAGTMRRDTAAERQAQRRLGALGFIPQAVMERARWILRSAPASAVIVAGGDWDYFPMGVAQTAEGLRPDVLVVQQPLLEFPWYVRWISARTGLPLPPQVQALGDDAWMPLESAPEPLAHEAASTWISAGHAGGARPLVIAVTADAEWVSDIAWPALDGGVYTLHPLPPDGGDGAAPDADALAASLRAVDVARLAGPVAHPTDRSPVRRTEGHPADMMVWMAAYWGSIEQARSNLGGMREAFAWADRVIATGAVSAAQAGWFAGVRGQIEAEEAAQ
ncbi:MAG TPA: hypothetical protein VHG93_19170 [Longimicrobium sp.]|nr:hypothetical protein [Longimicrobium sp.]